ncbi:hypothetical protein ENSA5_41150 [Enhygromyxa salina]|uniref:Lipoprotein n=1 Tax=Enhygromyxa salina TaxID=215803 RepID=A0A2S9XN55_9BACT|nr:hypothetical protein [Enhygromyxa salina]PRP94160.1 hypothetical protein ENSA5_41150 [Enhygromyxa salina]
MGGLSRLAALGSISLALAGGCSEELYEPNVLFFGEWIYIDGRDRSPEETCGGTFAYVDAYAGALAAEFGVSEQLGAYRWYSRDEYDAELPCSEVSACAFVEERIAHTPLLPHEHEIVHLAEIGAVGGACPSVLAEGLAEFYSAYSRDTKADDFELLVGRMAQPSGLAYEEYGILGRFAAYLVARFGLEGVLEVCRTTGRYPSGAQLSAALESVLGASTDELLADFEPELGACNEGERYRWRVFGCGVGEAAPDLGRVSQDREHTIDTTFTLDCANEVTIGPLGGKIWAAGRFDVDDEGVYTLWIPESAADNPEVELRIVECEPCGRPQYGYIGDLGSIRLDAGRHSIELHAPADFRGDVRVTID